MKGRLNLFQAAMLRWRDLDPYNAVHVARIAAPFDRERLRGVISAQLETTASPDSCSIGNAAATNIAAVRPKRSST